MTRARHGLPQAIRVLTAALPLLVACDTATGPAPTRAVGFPMATWALIQDFANWHPGFGGYHLAEDIDGVPGTAVTAMADGIVRRVLVNNTAQGYGGLVLVEHLVDGEYVTSLYGHLSSRTPPAVTEGERVSRGDLLGVLAADDEDGGPWGPHLHFGIRRGPVDVDARRCEAWPYVGYSRSCAGTTHDAFLEEWYDPTDYLVRLGATPPPSTGGPMR